VALRDAADQIALTAGRWFDGGALVKCLLVDSIGSERLKGKNPAQPPAPEAGTALAADG